MKCQHCENEATVHEVTVRNGVRVERHLCESCAAQQGIPVQGQASINELISKYLMAQGPMAAGPVPKPAARPTVCPTCAMSYAEFKQSGLLGCPDCYVAFEAQLGPLIERAHGGAGQHVGKSPRREARAPEAEREAMEERARRLRLIRKQLDDAVHAEQYERAAKLRDELRRLAGPGES